MRWNQIVLILVVAVVAMVVLQIPKLQQRQPTVKYEYWSQFMEEWNAIMFGIMCEKHCVR